ncbi:hypothetical protein TSUD_177630 [Trifolium subterraneum]|uniref:DUF674 family protein n=1 Tax=Trifolium subterraneum TaxID=3900 RepID=A0A2Z6P329_TRISU|nr:hypothetical protein TSUD_177630 [Trifolium subterraneum]
MAANVSDKQGHNDQVPLTVFVDKERNKVLYAEAGNDFVDALFSFLTLPLGTIARLVAKDSNIEPVRFGSISSLYQSVSDLDEEEHLWNQTCKEMLLKPRSSMESFCRCMKLKIDDTDTEQMKHFLCGNESCTLKNGRYFSFFRNQICVCGKLMRKETISDKFLTNGFVKKEVTFIVCDDLHVMPYDVGAYLELLRNLGVVNTGTIDEQIVNISKKEACFFSLCGYDTSTGAGTVLVPVRVLVRVIDLLKMSLVSKTPLSDFIFKRQQFVSNLDPRNRLEFWIANVEEQYDESTEIFLTFPFGGVVHMFKGLSFLSSIGYSRGPISYMVTDDLVVTPISSMKVISYLEEMNVPLNDVEDRFISIGVKEGLSILKASLTTTSALTNGLSLYIIEQFMNEQRSQCTSHKE